MVPEPSDKKRRLPWRHAIVVVAALFAFEQARASTSVYQHYLHIRPTSISGEANFHIERIRHALFRRPPGQDHEARQALLESILSEHRDRGLRYVFLWDKRDGPDGWLESGVRDISPFLPDLLVRGEPGEDSHEREGLVFKRLPDAQGFARLHLRRRPPHEGRRPGPNLGPRGTPPLMAIEYVPVQTNVLRDRALLTLVLGLLGALVSMCGGVYVWWLIGKKQAAEDLMQEQRIFAALGKMSALLAHELRNPLAAAMGQAQLLEELLPEGRHKERAEAIGHELERLEELTQNLLEFINSRRVDRQPHDTAGLVRDIQHLARSPKLRVHTEHVPASWTFDNVTMLRAIDNVVSNALSFTPEDGFVDLTLELRGGDLVIEVRDQGPGFPDDIDIFEPFVTTRIHGTGLGLAISQEIVRAHGGHITASNHEGGGALVTITLPYMDDLSEASFVEAI